MKKLIFSLIAGVAMIAGTSVESNACSGTITICPSQWDEYNEQASANCPEGSSWNLEILSAEDCGEDTDFIAPE